MNLFDIVSINKYYRMTDIELEEEASKWKIRGYGDAQEYPQRQIIIDALLKKDNANNARYAIGISLLALLVSIASILLKR